MEYLEFISKFNLHDFIYDPDATYILEKHYSKYFPLYLKHYNFPPFVKKILTREEPLVKRYSCYTMFEAVNVYGYQHIIDLCNIILEMPHDISPILLLINLNILPPTNFIHQYYWHDQPRYRFNINGINDGSVREILLRNYWGLFPIDITSFFH